MREPFINLTEENLEREHLCCIIRSKKPHPGVEAKRAWLRERLKEDHVFRKLDAKGVVFIEYAPLETAWVPVEGENYLYLYCLWVTGDFKGKGRPSQKNMGLKRWTPRRTATGCWPAPLTGQSPALRRTPRGWRWNIRS